MNYKEKERLDGFFGKSHGKQPSSFPHIPHIDTSRVFRGLESWYFIAIIPTCIRRHYIINTRYRVTNNDIRVSMYDFLEKFTTILTMFGYKE